MHGSTNANRKWLLIAKCSQWGGKPASDKQPIQELASAQALALLACLLSFRFSKRSWATFLRRSTFAGDRAPPRRSPYSRSTCVQTENPQRRRVFSPFLLPTHLRLPSPPFYFDAHTPTTHRADKTSRAAEQGLSLQPALRGL